MFPFLVRLSAVLQLLVRVPALDDHLRREEREHSEVEADELVSKDASRHVGIPILVRAKESRARTQGAAGGEAFW